jgi:hypothetical protein
MASGTNLHAVDGKPEEETTASATPFRFDQVNAGGMDAFPKRANNFRLIGA